MNITISISTKDIVDKLNEYSVDSDKRKLSVDDISNEIEHIINEYIEHNCLNIMELDELSDNIFSILNLGEL